MSGPIISLTHPLCHEVHQFFHQFFSPNTPYIGNINKTSQLAQHQPYFTYIQQYIFRTLKIEDIVRLRWNHP